MKIKENCAVFNTLIHHNSFWNRDSGHSFSIMRGLTFFNCTQKAEKVWVFEVVVCFSYKRFVLRRLSFQICSSIGSTFLTVSIVIATCLLKVKFDS